MSSVGTALKRCLLLLLLFSSLSNTFSQSLPWLPLSAASSGSVSDGSLDLAADALDVAEDAQKQVKEQQGTIIDLQKQLESTKKELKNERTKSKVFEVVLLIFGGILVGEIIGNAQH